MSLSARGSDLAWEGDPAGGAPWLKIVQPVAYDPDLSAYTPDPANDKPAQLRQQLEAKGKEKKHFEVKVAIACVDGTVEHLKLTEDDARRYLQAGLDRKLDEREAIVNRAIGIRRLTEALDAHALLSEGRTVTPEQEARLREFGGIATREKLRRGQSPLREHEATKDGPRLFEVLRHGFERAAKHALKELRAGRNLREDDGFFDCCFDSADGYYRPWSDREYIARGGPTFRQQLIADVWDAQAKAYYAYTHDPIIRQGCYILTDFPLGRGVRIVAKDAKLQNFIDDFLKRVDFDYMLPVWTCTTSSMGELFLRILRLGDGNIDLNALDGQTIWELVTHRENVNHVFYYVQRYQTRYMLDSGDVPDARITYIDRTIGASDMIHVKVNADSHDVRGRSDIFPALGWGKRLRDYADAEVQKSQAHAAYQWHITVDGGAADLQRIASLIPSGKPQPGSSFVTNSKVEVGGVNTGTAAGTSGNGSTYELLLNQIANAFGVPKDYFGVTSRGSRATALVAADPASKRFEARQNIIKSKIVEPIITAAIDEARRFNLLDGVQDWTWRATFPAIVKADAKTRADLLRQACAAGIISHKTMAEEFIGELDLEDYDYLQEMQQIKTEIGVEGWHLSGKDMSSVKRGLPSDKDVAFDPGEVPDPAYAGGAGGDDDPAMDGGGTKSPLGMDAAAKIHGEVGAHEVEARKRRVLAEAARIVSAAGGICILP